MNADNIIITTIFLSQRTVAVPPCIYNAFVDKIDEDNHEHDKLKIRQQ